MDAYFPEGVWYDFARDGAPLGKNGWVTLPATLAEINVHIRGGYIVPGQEPALTTVATRNNPFSVYVSGDTVWPAGRRQPLLFSCLFSHPLRQDRLAKPMRAKCITTDS